MFDIGSIYLTIMFIDIHDIKLKFYALVIMIIVLLRATFFDE